MALVRYNNKNLVTKKELNRRLRGRPRPETKFFDVTTTTPITTSGIVLQMNDIPQGDGFGERDGNSAVGRGVKWELTLNRSTSATIWHHVRVVIVEPKNPDDFESNPANFVTLSKFFKENMARRVLYDKIHLVTHSGGNPFSDFIIRGSTKFGRYVQKIDWRNNATAKASSGRLVMYLISDSNSAAEDVTCELSSRYYYNDM